MPAQFVQMSKLGKAAVSETDWTSVKDLAKAADKGDRAAQELLAFRLIKGDGVERDLTLAVHYYRLAADNGSHLAQHNLGCMYLNGDGVPRNVELAQAMV